MNPDSVGILGLSLGSSIALGLAAYSNIIKVVFMHDSCRYFSNMMLKSNTVEMNRRSTSQRSDQTITVNSDVKESRETVSQQINNN